MPELPEVETIVRELRSKIINEIFSGAETLWPKSFQTEAELSIENEKINKINRIGKYIIFYLHRGYLVTHLRMTGQLLVNEKLPDDTRYLRIIFKFKSGKYLLFYDLRKFGRIHLTTHWKKILINTGIDALSREFTKEKFESLTNGKKIRVKSFLLNQKYIAGLGNIYIDESLFRAGVHPENRLCDIPADKKRDLYNAIKETLLKAITNMGTSLSDYRTTGGGFGDNQNYLMVYDRENQPCFDCGTLITKIKHSSRGTHFCSVCQENYSQDLI
jgi:formamidopyrimidine-DNA glycosylase